MVLSALGMVSFFAIYIYSLRIDYILIAIGSLPSQMAMFGHLPAKASAKRWPGRRKPAGEVVVKLIKE